MAKEIMFKDTSYENITKRIVVHDRIGSSGKYGMEMDDDAFRYVNFDRAKGDLIVNKTTMGGCNVLPATDGMMETLAHIAENLEYVEVDEHIVKIKTE